MQSSKDYRMLGIRIFEKVILICVILFLCGIFYYGQGILSAWLSIQSIERQIEQPQYADFTSSLAANAAAIEASVQESVDKAAPAPVDKERAEYAPLLDQISTKLWNFADRTKQLVPQPAATEEIFERCRAVRDKIPLRQNLENLLAQLQTLQQQADSLATMDRLDLRYFTWADFLNFYFMGISRAIEDMERRQAEQISYNKMQKSKIEDDTKGILIIFSLFCMGMMCFVVISIQRNTQAMLQLKDALAGSAPAPARCESSNHIENHSCTTSDKEGPHE